MSNRNLLRMDERALLSHVRSPTNRETERTMTDHTERETIHEALAEFNVKGLTGQGVAEADARAAVEQWNAGEKPRTPVERGCFEVFRLVFADMKKHEGKVRETPPPYGTPSLPEWADVAVRRWMRACNYGPQDHTGWARPILVTEGRVVCEVEAGDAIVIAEKLTGEQDGWVRVSEMRHEPKTALDFAPLVPSFAKAMMSRETPPMYGPIPQGRAEALHRAAGDILDYLRAMGPGDLIPVEVALSAAMTHLRVPDGTPVPVTHLQSTKAVLAFLAAEKPQGSPTLYRALKADTTTAGDLSALLRCAAECAREINPEANEDLARELEDEADAVEDAGDDEDDDEPVISDDERSYGPHHRTRQG